jgi:uncharacterized protein (DUF433 family)
MTAALQKNAAEILSSPDILGGTPCVAGTRIPAENVRQCLMAGYSRLEIFRHYPTLPVGGVEAVAAWAASQGLSCSAS